MPKAKSLYGVHPGVRRIEKWIGELKETSGRSLEEWLDLLKKSGPKDEKSRREWLKKEHGFGTNAAWWIAQRAEGELTAEEYVEQMFSGGKAGLRPLYNKLLHLGLGVADDVKACPCRTMVPLFRKHVFAQIKPTTQTRIDMGFALGARKVQGRLIDTGGYAKKDRITHRIPISSAADIDDEVKRWLRLAYEEDV